MSSILQLSKAAVSYYNNLKAPSLVQGWEKYVATDGNQSLFVGNDYVPQKGEALFFICMRNRNVSCQLHRAYEELKECGRFSIGTEGGIAWTAKDWNTGSSLTFYDGLLGHHTQKVERPEGANEITEWILQNHRQKAVCEIDARKELIRKIGKPEYWLSIADAQNGLKRSEKFIARKVLIATMEDYFDINPLRFVKTDEDARKLLSALNSLTVSEANEAITIVENFWESSAEIDAWAEGVLSWPSIAD